MNWDAIDIGLEAMINDRLVAERKLDEAIKGFAGFHLGQDFIKLVLERHRCRVARDFAQILKDAIAIGRVA